MNVAGIIQSPTFQKISLIIFFAIHSPLAFAGVDVIGNWQSDCTLTQTGRGSIQGDITFSSDGTFHSTEFEYVEPTCVGEVVGTETVESKFSVLSSNETSAEVLMTDFIEPSRSRYKTASLKFRVTMESKKLGIVKTLAGSVLDTKTGATLPLTQTEIDLLPLQYWVRTGL